jgi:signal peptidase II
MSPQQPEESSDLKIPPPASGVGSNTCCSGFGWIGGVVVAVLYALDQATKLWTVRNFELGERKIVFGTWFEWVHFSNTGAAFGIMQDSNRFFIGLSAVAAIAIGVFLKKNLFPGKLNFAALILLLAGIFGNVTDRFLHGYVVDFLLFDFGFPPFNPWPAFNVADSCICVSVGLLLLVSFEEEVERRAALKRGQEGR